MTQDDLCVEVHRMIQARVEAGEIVAAAWLTQEIVAHHPDVSGSDADFYILCAYEHGRRTVREVLRHYAADREGEPDQLMLPVMAGFDRLRRAYLVKREAERLIIPIEQMTAKELRAKAAEYRSIGSGCYQHADEIDRYTDRRAAA